MKSIEKRVVFSNNMQTILYETKIFDPFFKVNTDSAYLANSSRNPKGFFKLSHSCHITWSLRKWPPNSYPP